MTPGTGLEVTCVHGATSSVPFKSGGTWVRLDDAKLFVTGLFGFGWLGVGGGLGFVVGLDG